MKSISQSSLRRTGFLILGAIAGVVAPLAAESVAIRVETQKGKPIEGAVVSVRDSENGTVLDSAVSSNEGVAIIQQLTPGEWYFEIDRSGYMLYTAYVQVRAGKKPELGFASQVSRGDDWEPMRVKFTKVNDKLMRKAVIAAAPEPRMREPIRDEPRRVTPEPEPEAAPAEESRPEHRPAPEDVTRIDPPEPAAGTLAVPSTVEDVEAETVPSGEESPTELTVADGDPEPLEGAAPQEPLVDEPAIGAPSDVKAPAPEPENEVEADATTATATAEPLETDRATEPGQAEVSDPEPAPVPEAAVGPEAGSEPQLEEPSTPAAEQPVEPTPAPESEAQRERAGEPTTTEELPAEDAGAAIPEPDTPADPAPESTSVEPEPVAPAQTGPPTATRSLRSAAAGTCPECAAGEWAISADVKAATAGDTRSTSTCAEDLAQRVHAFAEEIAARPQEPYAGSLTAALWRTADDADRARLAEAAAAFNRPQGFCQVAGVVLPARATMTGYVLEAWDELGGRACNAEGICALGKAAWEGAPVIVSGDNATVVYAIFRNRSTRHQRSAELTVLFTPPPEWQ